MESPTVDGRNKRLFLERKESGEGRQRAREEENNVNRRNTTRRRLNPFEEGRAAVSEIHNRLFRPTLPSPVFPRDSDPRIVALGEGLPRRPPSLPPTRTRRPRALNITDYFVCRR